LKFTPPRGGEREGRWVFPDPGGFSGLEIFFFFDYWELGVRVTFLFGDRILDLMGLVCEQCSDRTEDRSYGKLISLFAK
jgi:hypothetical protein